MSKNEKPREFRIVSPTAILGYGFPERSLERGMEREPHMIAVDAGSTDPGPYYLGSGKSFTDREFVKRDLRLMLRAARGAGIPLVIGTAGGSGAAPHLEWCRRIILEIAEEDSLVFKMGVIASDLCKEAAARALGEGRISPLSCVHELTEAHIHGSAQLVAQLGVEPLQEALRLGCDVVLAGRCYDPAVFAALPIMLGFDPGPALHMGKILECAAIAATPGSGADCVMGTLRRNSFVLESLNPERSFTAESAAAHTLYEKSDPYRLPGPGGVLNLERTVFKELSGGRVEVGGSRFEADEVYRLKLEGARRIGFRTISIAGVRDPVMIGGIRGIVEEVRAQVAEMSPPRGASECLSFRLYGVDGVMGALEPLRDAAPHEVGIVIDALCETQERADTLCSLARSTLLHYGYAGRIATAGNLAFPFSPSDIAVGEVYEFSVYHLMEPGPRDVFPVRVETAGKSGVER